LRRGDVRIQRTAYASLLFSIQKIHASKTNHMANLYSVCVSRPEPSSSSSFAVGSLKKGSKQTLSLPSPGFNTLPHLRTTTSSPRFIQQQQVAAAGPSPSHHKRSPSSDSGHGTMHNNAQQQQMVPSGPGSGGGGISNVRSNTPVSYHGSTSGGRIGEGGSSGRIGSGVVREVGKVPHTVYLHGKWELQ
jgi:hypothetical protein